MNDLKKHFNEIEKNISYTFQDKKLLELAFTHSSFANENKNNKKINNERVEFLGDSVINLIISELLYNFFPNDSEGVLSKKRSILVCEESFANIANMLKLGDFLLLGKGENQTGGRSKPSILADTFEALSGAIFLDSDYTTTKLFISSKFDFSKNLQINLEKNSDYKSLLQFYQHKNGNDLEYSILNIEGPDHDKKYFIECKYGEIHSVGIGKNKKNAEQKAAKEILIKLGEI